MRQHKYHKARINPEHHISYLYEEINKRVACKKQYTYINLEFTEDEFINFIHNQMDLFTEIWNNWETSGFKKGFCPTVDRVDPKGHYSLNNIQIITHSENSGKDKRNFLIYKGELKSVIELANRFGIDKGVVHARLSIGWSIQEALTTPVRKLNRLKTKRKEV